MRFEVPGQCEEVAASFQFAKVHFLSPKIKEKHPARDWFIYCKYFDLRRLDLTLLEMTPHRLESLLSRFSGLSVMVVGDFFLDKYLVLDPALDEPSLETGLAARQVVARRCMPGAAGTVVANLHALGVGDLLAVGVTGDDGEGYELRQGLSAMGVRLDGLFESPDRFTPTYIKPMNREPGRRKGIKSHRHTEPDTHASGSWKTG